MSKRSAAARKGWETRRARAAERAARAARRSAAAKAGWVTRRRKAARKALLQRQGEIYQVTGEPSVVERPPMSGELQPGTEIELSVRYAAKTQRGHGGRATGVRYQLYLKIRLTLRVPMSRADALKQLRRTVHSNRIQPGVDLAWVNWAKGEGYRRKEGEYIGENALQALRAFHNVIMNHDATRISIVGDAEESW